MTRAWPFESDQEAEEGVREPLAHLEAIGRTGAEAVVMRIGWGDAQLVIVGADGAWQRWVYRTVAEAERVAGRLGVPVHIGEYPEATRVRMNAHQRSRADFDAGAYPEQGAVGPVRAYSENRPRARSARRRRGSANPTG